MSWSHIVEALAVLAQLTAGVFLLIALVMTVQWLVRRSRTR